MAQTGRPEGRPPTPNEAKRKRGTARPDRGVPALSNVVQLERVVSPEPVRALGRVGRAMWDSAWENAGAWLARTDMETLQLVCEQLDERSILRAQVLSGERGLDGKPTGVADWRARLALRQLDVQILAGLSVLGFTPTDRSRLGVAEVARVDKLDQLRRRSSGA